MVDYVSHVDMISHLIKKKVTCKTSVSSSHALLQDGCPKEDPKIRPSQESHQPPRQSPVCGSLPGFCIYQLTERVGKKTKPQTRKPNRERMRLSKKRVFPPLSPRPCLDCLLTVSLQTSGSFLTFLPIQHRFGSPLLHPRRHQLHIAYYSAQAGGYPDYDGLPLRQMHPRRH